MDGNWKQSSYCAASECAQVRWYGGMVQVRDSAGTVLTFTPAAWAAFTKHGVAWG